MAFRIGLVGLCTSHPEGWVPVMRELVKAGRADVEVAAAWDSGETRPAGFAREFCEKFAVPHAVDHLDEMMELVDGVIVHTTNWDRHLEQAKPFVEAGKSVFLDKPVAGNMRELSTVLDWIRQGRRVTGGSVLRYCKEIRALRETVAAAGETICTAYTAIGVDDFNYGIHGYATLCAALGPGIQSVRYAGCSNQKQIVLQWRGGRIGLLTVGKTKWLPFNLTAVTEGHLHQVAVDNTALYRSMLENVLPYFSGATDTPPLAAETLLEPEMAALAAKKSWREGGSEVFLSDLGVTGDLSYDGTMFALEYRRARMGA